MKYGNCLIGALVLRIKYRKIGAKISYKRGSDTKIPHFIVKTNKGFYHYKVIEDILPWPFSFMLFQGKFVKRSD